jgi:hypothetical protein
LAGKLTTLTVSTANRQALAVKRVNADTVKSFCTALKERLADPTSGLGKAYPRRLVDEIKLDGNEPIATGSPSADTSPPHGRPK